MQTTHRSLCAGVAAAMTLALTAPAVAADSAAEQKKLEQAFKAADKNGDGKLSLAEAKDGKVGMPRVAKNFDRIDANKDGFVTLDEINAARGGR